jgi:hypothetical protein
MVGLLRPGRRLAQPNGLAAVAPGCLAGSGRERENAQIVPDGRRMRIEHAWMRTGL